MITMMSNDGFALRGLVAGSSGIPLLLVHGFPFDHTQWQPQLVGLTHQATILAPDIRGLGSSEGPEEHALYSMERYAADLVAWMDHMAWESAVVCGLSMGGYIILAMLEAAPERFRGVVLMDTHARADTDEAREGRRRSRERIRREGMAGLASDLLQRVVGTTTLRNRSEVTAHLQWMMSRAPANGVAGALEAMASRPDRTHLLPDIGVPALALVGSEDALTPPDVVRAMAGQIPGAACMEIPDAGHVVSLEAPEATNAALLTFLESLR